MPLDRVRCPTCRREVSWAETPSRPFCSARCRMSDFGGWTSERYRIPGSAEDELAEGEEEDE